VTTKHNATIWSICTVVRCHKLGDMNNECTSHNFIVLAIGLPKITKFGRDFKQFWQKQVESFLAYPV